MLTHQTPKSQNMECENAENVEKCPEFKKLKIECEYYIDGKCTEENRACTDSLCVTCDKGNNGDTCCLECDCEEETCNIGEIVND